METRQTKVVFTDASTERTRSCGPRTSAAGGRGPPALRGGEETGGGQRTQAPGLPNPGCEPAPLPGAGRPQAAGQPSPQPRTQQGQEWVLPRAGSGASSAPSQRHGDVPAPRQGCGRCGTPPGGCRCPSPASHPPVPTPLAENPGIRAPPSAPSHLVLQLYWEGAGLPLATQVRMASLRLRYQLSS